MQKANRGIYLIVGIFVRQIECLHGTYHAAHCHEDVLIDKFDEASLVIIWVATAVDDSHLLYECALARLTSACVIHKQPTHSSSSSMHSQYGL